MKKKLSLTLTVLFLLVTLILLCSCDKVQSDGQDTDSTDTVTTALESEWTYDQFLEALGIDGNTVFKMDSLLKLFETPREDAVGDSSFFIGTDIEGEQYIQVFPQGRLPENSVMTYSRSAYIFTFDSNREYATKIKIFSENLSILDLYIGMSFGDAVDILGDYKVVSTFDDGYDFTTQSIIDKYSVTVKWELSIDDMELLEKIAYTEKIDVSATANENIYNFIAESDVGVIQTIEVTLAE